jgi:hypothetical protein
MITTKIETGTLVEIGHEIGRLGREPGFKIHLHVRAARGPLYIVVAVDLVTRQYAADILGAIRWLEDDGSYDVAEMTICELRIISNNPAPSTWNSARCARSGRRLARPRYFAYYIDLMHA